jgi:hypothetical protein
VNGLTLLAPAGLFALAALAVPLLIHLFSRSRGKRVLVGNIALYRQAQRQRVTEVRLVQWLLLLLRLLLLALAALLLAQLAQRGLETLQGDTAYVTPEWLGHTPDVAAALAAFDNRYVLGPGTGSMAGVDASGTEDPWSLLAERLATVQHTGEVHVFALGAAGQFPDAPPAFGSTLTWHIDRAAGYPATGTATPAGGRFAQLAIQLLHAPGREADAARIQLALEALATHRNLALSLDRGPTSRPPRPPSATTEAEQRIMIWLGDAPAPQDLVRAWGDGVWLEDRPANPATVRSEARLPHFPQLHAMTRRAGPADGIAETEAVPWWNADGQPLLLETRLGQTRRLVYQGRLDDDGLVANAAFPEALFRLLLGEAAWGAGFDRAPADPTAVLTRENTASTGPARPLAPWLALAIALLFVLERWLSERPRRSALP